MDVDCHPCASKQEQIVKFACREQGFGRAVERSKRSSWRKCRSRVRGRTAPGRRTVKLRYFASSCAKVATENSTFELGHFQLFPKTQSRSARIMYLVSEFQFLVPPFMLYRMRWHIWRAAFLAEPGQTPHITTHGSMAAGGYRCRVCAQGGVWWKRGGGRAGARQGRTAQNSGRMFVVAVTLVPTKATRHPA